MFFGRTHTIAVFASTAERYISVWKGKKAKVSPSIFWTLCVSELGVFLFFEFARSFLQHVSQKGKRPFATQCSICQRLRHTLARFLSNNVSAQGTEDMVEDAHLAGASFCSDIGHPESVAADREKKKRNKHAHRDLLRKFLKGTECLTWCGLQHVTLFLAKSKVLNLPVLWKLWGMSFGGNLLDVFVLVHPLRHVLPKLKSLLWTGFNHQTDLIKIP